MSNPIFSQAGNSSPSNPQSNLLNLLAEIRKSPNPESAIESMVVNNPQYANVMNYISQNGGSAKAAFYNMAAQKGIDPNSILRYLK